ncbi:MAG: hypothetical protein DHS20C18_35790 [Saprospiraceae bacterium]|nr:MAG: hypothetical protein DHS20C18_35790 [Saprospiraceae bacterium]
MKKLILLFISTITVQFIQGQNFQEVCENSVVNGTIVDYQSFGDTIYATGFFSTICNETVGYIAKWENNEWKPSAINITDPGHAFEVIDNQLYIAKYEESIDSNWVYVYNNSSLEKVGSGVYLTTASGFSVLPHIYDIVEFDGKIVACGEFDRVGQQSINGIMQWDGDHWEPLGDGFTGNILNTAPVIYPHQMLVHNSELYVVGNFRYAGGEEANGIAKWDGTQWTNMAGGFNNTVYGIAIFDNEIIAGGAFTESNGTAVDRIAKWDGTQWTPLDFGFTATSPNDFIFVHTLKVIDDILYIGGGLKEVTYADNSTQICNGIVSYNGSSLNTFDGGVAGNDIEAIIKTEDQQLLIGGGVFGSGYSGITNINTSIEEELISREVQIFPNPFENSIHISARDNFEKYILFDTKGTVIKAGEFEATLNLELLPGMYILKLINENTYTAHKIIKR